MTRTDILNYKQTTYLPYMAKRVLSWQFDDLSLDEKYKGTQ